MTAGPPFRYPDARRDTTVVEDLHGTPIADPYRWLEDPAAPETRAWVEAQNRLTFAFLEEIPARPRILARLTELWDYPKLGVPGKHGGRYFFFKNDGLQNQSVLYTTRDLARLGEARVLLDPNALSPDGTVALTGMSVSDDGRRFAYGLSAAGSDWQEWRVRDVETGDDLPDHLRWVRFSTASFTKDGTGFFYSRYDEPPAGEAHTAPAYHQKLCYHRLGAPQSEDELVYHRPDHKEWGFHGAVTEDGRYLVISVWRGTEPKNRVFYRDLAAGAADGKVIELLPDADAAYHFVGNDGPRFWFHTDRDAQRGRLVEIDVATGRRRELVGEAPETLQGVSFVGGRFFFLYLEHAHSRVRVHDRSGARLHDVELPGLGTVTGFAGRSDDDETFFSFTSYTAPARIYRHEPATGATALTWAPELKFDPGAYQTRQVFFASRDGTQVPMFIVHRNDIAPDGDNPTYLYGYGGFNISLTPAFDPARLVWLEQGGVLAVANLRGGGEYGEAWHQAGSRARRQNVFDDFIAAAEWLIDNRWTSRQRLAIGGGSNGGLLVGACLTQRPELYAAATPDVGVLDMLRFHKFTIGWAWISDYGNPDDAEDFRVLLRYSPLHAIRPGASYPATLITTADTDDRVVSAHSFKFAAALQAAQAGEAPILIRVETRAGHGAGKPTSKLIALAADRWAFLWRVLRMGGKP
jgi:prolyl oligopeptidase